VDVSESGVDKSKVGLGAVLGGVLGAVVGGGKGALLGAVVGGGGAVVATKGDEVELPAGTVVTLRLEEPLPVARR
jgi:outer membrane lipoprotein SlyB